MVIPRVYSVCFYPFSHLSYFPIAVLHQKESDVGRTRRGLRGSQPGRGSRGSRPGHGSRGSRPWRGSRPTAWALWVSACGIVFVGLGLGVGLGCC